MKGLNTPVSAETISKKIHLPLWAVKKALQWLAKRGSVVQTADGLWKASPNGIELAEEIEGEISQEDK